MGPNSSVVSPLIDDRSASLAPSRIMRARFLRELAAAGLPSGPGPRDPVTREDVEALPGAVQRYLSFMSVLGRPRVWSFRARSGGTFRMAPARPWMPIEAWQYNSGLEVARIFHMRMRFGHVLPVYVRDTYVRGRGRMLGRILGTFNIVDVASEQIDTSELVTYLNDAILFAPSMLLGPETTWSAVTYDSFDVTFADCGATVKARVFIDERGAVTDFSTTDRFGTDPANPKEMVRARWSTPIRGWKRVEDRPVPIGGSAIWHFASGDFTYADFSFESIELNVSPRPGHAS
jgi:hypothetical protein